MIKGIIFDFDGTLVDTLTDLVNSINYALKINNYPISYSLEEGKNLIGAGTKNLCIRALKPFTSDEEKINKVFSDFTTYYSIHQTDHVCAYEHMVETLKELKKMGLKIAILSNKVEDNTKYIVNKVFKNNYFDVVFGQRLDIPLKPNPTSTFMVLEELNLKNEEVLYVGDSDTDMVTAENAKIKKVAVSYGYRSIEVLKQYNPNYLIDDPRELIKIIEKANKIF